MKPSLHYQFLHANIYSLISSNEFSCSLCSLKAGASAFKYRDDFAGGYFVELRCCSASVL